MGGNCSNKKSQQKRQTNGNSTLEGLEVENFSTEETLVAILNLLIDFSTKVTADTKDTKNKTDKHQNALAKYFQSIVGGAVGGEAAANASGAGTISNILSPILQSFLPLGDFLIEIAELTPEILLAIVAFKAVTTVLHLFQAGLNLVSRTITSLFSVAGNLVGTLFSGKTAMNDYIAAIQRGTESIPIIGFFTKLCVCIYTNIC